MAPQNHFDHIHGGLYVSLVDKTGLLAGKTFPMYSPTEAQQLGTLHKQITAFGKHIIALHCSHTSKAAMDSQYERSLDEMRISVPRSYSSSEARFHQPSILLTPKWSNMYLKMS